MPEMRASIPLLLTAFLLCGCTDVRDSASGVTVDTLPTGTIVVRNNPAPAAGVAPWRLELVARLGADSTGDIVFGRVTDVAIGPNDNIYILDGQASEVLVFTPFGRLIRRFGRPGPGPGEFASGYALTFDREGRLWLAEERNNRYTVFTAAGDFVETHRRPLGHTLTRGVLRFSLGGDLYELSTVGTRGAFRLAVTDSVAVRDTSPLPAANVVAFREATGTGEQLLAIVPFSPRQVATIGLAGEPWVSSGESYRLVQLSPDGDTTRVIEKSGGAVPLSPEERAKAESDADRYTREGYEVDRTLIPDFHPAMSAITVADNGEIWVRRVSSGGSTTGTERAFVYDVFGPEGVFLGSVPAPFALSPAPHITTTHIAGVVMGLDDIPLVEVHRIVRP